MFTLRLKEEFAELSCQVSFGLDPEMYSFSIVGKQKLSSSKGVTQFAQTQLQHQLYRDVLRTGESFKTIDTAWAQNYISCKQKQQIRYP